MHTSEQSFVKINFPKKKVCRPSSKSVQALLALVPHLYQVMARQFLSDNHTILMYDKHSGYVLLGSEPPTLQLSLNFYRCQSCIIQQAGGEIER